MGNAEKHCYGGIASAKSIKNRASIFQMCFGLLYMLAQFPQISLILRLLLLQLSLLLDLNLAQVVLEGLRFALSSARGKRLWRMIEIVVQNGHQPLVKQPRWDAHLVQQSVNHLCLRNKFDSL